ncbi:hypothetical protein PENSPDRAFT_687865 [Peniophora sp. CONT]|nr:hypothetical protein PENSPDRAFT_687865 [Peniophora sp. CONT]
MATFATNMPLSHEDQYLLASILPVTTSKVVAAAPARLYQAAFATPNTWSSTGRKGVLVFGYDSTARSRSTATSASRVHWLRLVDLRRGSVLWTHEMRELAEYETDKPFFHVLTSTNCLFGFRFEEDEDAAAFYAQVTHRVVETPARKRPTPSRSSSSSSIPTVSKPVDRTKISSPVTDSFEHVGHLSPTDETPEWGKLVSRLENYGIEAELVEENIEFVKGFLAGAEVVRETVAHSSSRSSASGSPKSTSQPSLKSTVHSSPQSPQSTHVPAPYSRGSSKSSSLESLDDYYSHERGASRDYYRHAPTTTTSSRRPAMPKRAHSDYYHH